VTANNPTEPVNGGKVTFTPPAFGASAALSGSPATIAGGNASVTATANDTAGAYNVTASASGAPSVDFALTNIATYSLTYDGNGSTGGSVPVDSASPYASTEMVTILGNSGSLVRTGYTFANNWNNTANGTGLDFAPGAAITMPPENFVLYAKWTANNYTVTFDANGGGAPSLTSKSVMFDSAYGTLATVSRAGYAFNGWFDAATGGTEVTAATLVSTASNHTLYAQWMLNTVPALTSFTRQTPAASPTNADTLIFRATFNVDVQNVDAGDFAVSGTTASIAVASVSASVYDITITGGDLANLNGAVGLNLAVGQDIQDLVGNALSIVEPGTDEIYDVNNSAPLVASTNLSVTYTGIGPSSFVVTFSENVNNAGGGMDSDDAANPANYRLINKGADGTVNTGTCANPLAGDDTQVIPSSVVYIPNTAVVTFALPLPVGNYRLSVCGTTSIVDPAGNHLNNGVDSAFDFAVSALAGDSGTNDKNGSDSANTWSLPKTGFAPNMVTRLPEQPAELAYTKMSDLWLEIPSQNVKANIVGVPQSENVWDVKWLGNDAGWLNGTAFPSWEGNSVITAHVMGADGLPGPFAKLQDLKYGEQVIVHMLDQQYVFEIRNKRLVRPDSTAFAFEHLEDHSYLTLITCQDYDPDTDSYRLRRVVRAVLVAVK